jgi:uncharacterized membrane protein YgdD (TMEM256/DUF423 family)
MLLLKSGSLIVAFGIILGAFGAHSLKDILTEYSMSIYEKGIFYHTIHGLSILVLNLNYNIKVISLKHANLICSLFIAGIILFSGSLYIFAITGLSWLGAITPLGGVSFILGWIVWYLVSLKK